MSDAGPLEGIPSSVASDALGKSGWLPGLRWIAGPTPVAGPAVTAACVGDSLASVLDAVVAAPAGAVVCATAESEVAHMGEVLGAELVRRGIAGFAIDGLVRDAEELDRLGLAVHARGVTPVGGLVTDRGSAGQPLTFGPTTVRPGDWIVADADGVVAVPAERLEEVADAARAIMAREEETVRRVGAGEPLFDLLGLDFE